MSTDITATLNVAAFGSAWDQAERVQSFAFCLQDALIEHEDVTDHAIKWTRGDPVVTVEATIDVDTGTEADLFVEQLVEGAAIRSRVGDRT